MTKNLVIVESPSKSKTIEKYLGKDYKVVSSKGHIRDLATSGKLGLGVDIENGFKPNYVPLKGKSKLIKELKKDVKESDHIILATDPDREGEAISWHLKEALNIKDDDYSRVLFHEITKDSVLEAIKHEGKIDQNLVKSQETRRILDRIIGFRLSKLLQSKIKAKSAGRVQSVALKLIVDREREIEAFKQEEYYTISAFFDETEANLFEYNDKEIKLTCKDDADKVINSLGSDYKVYSVEEKLRNKKSKAPFTTSTLQQEAANKLGFPTKKTMMIAQKLYEGIDLGSETTGLITYMRTDSIRLSDEFIHNTFNYIEKNYGKEFVGYPKQAKKKENVQDAHEGIRPTSILRRPEDVKSHLSSDEFKLYRLIYYRALASLMADAKVNQTTVLFDNNNYHFKATGSVIVFKGYLEAYATYEASDENYLAGFVKDQVLKATDLVSEQHFTKPPARYTEASLVKKMEELGIGRPSTYAQTIDTLKQRAYVTLEEKKFHPTEMGVETTDKLQEFFKDLINVEYTREMEEDLDKIASGELVWNEVLKEFYDEFEPRVKKAFDEMEKAPDQETGEKCPECGHPLVIRKGKYGEFTACSNYPECKYVKKEEKQVIEVVPCPNCDGMILERKTRKGKTFYGCSNYPKCKTAFWDKPLDEKCPNCNSILLEHGNEIKCSSCDYKKSK